MMGTFGVWKRRVPVVLQTERTECGLACLAMVATYHGHDVDLPTLRQRYAMSAMGATLKDLVGVAGRMQLQARAIKAPLETLAQLALPVVLHWDFAHWVVLVEARQDGGLVVHDPAKGRCEVAPREASELYTGIAVELAPGPDFERVRERTTLSFRTLLRGAMPNTVPLVHGLLFALIAQLFGLGVPLLSRFVMDTVAPSGNLLDAQVVGLAMVLLALGLFVANIARGVAFAFVGNAVHGHLARNLFRHLIDLPLSYFQRQHSAQLIAQFDSLRVLQRTLSVTFIESVVDGFALLVTLVLLCAFEPRLAAVGLACATTYGALRQYLQRRYVRLNDDFIIKGSKAYSSFSESIRGIETLKAHNGQHVRASTWNSLLTNWFNTSTALQSLVAFSSAAASATQTLTLALSLWVGIHMNLNGSLTMGALVASLSMLNVFAFRATALVDRLCDFRMLSIHRARLSDVHVVEPEKDLHGHGSRSVGPIAGALSLVDVWFRYDAGGPWLMKGAHLKIDAGEFVAVTAPSGSGKSTLLRLMLGLLEPERGHVEVDGYRLDYVGKAGYREQIGVVLQNDVLFSGTIGENICSFDPMPDYDHMRQCAQTAGILDTIDGFAMGFRTLVGDMGSVLSGGQQQRVFLARALYRRPRILFMDEATSHLDVMRERAINESMSRLGITRIVFAHREETIRAANRVVALVDGELVVSADARVA